MHTSLTVGLVLLLLSMAIVSAQADEIGWRASGKGGAVVAGGSRAVAAGRDILASGGMRPMQRWEQSWPWR